MLDDFEEKSFENQLFHNQFNISSQNVLNVLQALHTAFTLGYY